MKKALLTTSIFLMLLVFNISAQSIQQPSNDHCKVSTERQSNNPVLVKEREDLEAFTQHFSMKDLNGGNCYVIPVVFHVYGTTQGGLPVNDALIIDALNKVNLDFHGLNSDFGTVHNSFLSIRGTMLDVQFALAELDPSGSPTTGIVYHPVAAGFANGSGYDALIQADAWDNYMYMNIYVMNDLFDDGVTNNSGYAYYPSTFMSNNNTARIVYNGAYLGTNTSAEFASTLSHEFGHWLNLIHTFDGGCVAPNDNVADTPPCDYLGTPYPCHATASSNAPLNCNSNLINAENYMDYSGASGCYKMFTQGQTTRMYAALSVASRQPLWQNSNLVLTGLDYLCNTSGINTIENSMFQIYPNPSNGIFDIRLKNNASFEEATVIEVTDLLGKVIHLHSISNITTSIVPINISNAPKGFYFVNIHLKGATQTFKIVIN